MVPRPKQQKQQRTQQPRRAANRDMQINIPFTAVTQIHQSAKLNATSTFSGTDRIGGITFGPATPLGVPVIFKMSPPDLPNTRLATMARNFQLFRFKKLVLTVFSNLPSTSGGSFTAAYTENPDQAFTNGTALSSQVFSLPGAVAGNMFVPTKMSAAINDRAKWYRIDEDTEEVMNSTQGMFVISVDSLTAITTAITVPVFLEYVVEFKGSALQKADVSGAPFIFGAQNVSTNANPLQFSLVVIPGEPLSSPAPGVPHLINPGFQVGEENVEVLLQASINTYQFYTSEEAFRESKPLTNYGITFPFQTPRTTLQSLNQ